jgi:hypothetical protein
MVASNLQKEPDVLRRRVLFAVGLVDPLTGEFISSGIKVSVDGLVRRPIVNRTGYFVWLVEGDARPSEVTVIPDGAPYERETVAVDTLPPPPPEDPSLPIDRKDEPQRRLHIFLRPTAAYPFPDGAIIVRGKLRETDAPNAPGVTDARIGLDWNAEPPPTTTLATEVAHWISSPAAAATSEHGEFTVALALPPGAKPAHKTTFGLRLRCERAGDIRTGIEIVLPPVEHGPIKASDRNSYFFNDPVIWNQLKPLV